MPDLTEPRVFILGLIRRFENIDAEAVTAKAKRKFPSYGDEQAREDFSKILSLSKSYANDDDVLAAMGGVVSDVRDDEPKKTRFQRAAEIKERERQDKAARAERIAARAERIRESQEASNYVRQIYNYKIVSAKTKAELSQNVNKELKRGWYPYGGVSFAALGMSPVGGNQYIQAMVRFK